MLQRGFLKMFCIMLLTLQVIDLVESSSAAEELSSLSDRLTQAAHWPEVRGYKFVMCCVVLCSVLCCCCCLSCLVLSCLFLPCLVLSCLALLVLSCLALPCLALPCLVLSCLVLSCFALPCLITPRVVSFCYALLSLISNDLLSRVLSCSGLVVLVVLCCIVNVEPCLFCLCL